jgi:hypothetical protein
MRRLAICVSHYRESFNSRPAGDHPFLRLLEMQVIAVALIENFEFSLPPQNDQTRIYRKPTGLMVPMAEAGQGAWMGLVVKSVD